ALRRVSRGPVRHQGTLRRRAREARAQRRRADHRDQADEGRAGGLRQVRGCGAGARREAEALARENSRTPTPGGFGGPCRGPPISNLETLMAQAVPQPKHTVVPYLRVKG